MDGFDYLKKRYNNIVMTNKRDYLTKLITAIKDDLKSEFRIACKIKELETKYERLCSPIVRGENYGSDTCGNHDGYHRNEVEDLYIKREETKYEIAILTAKQIDTEHKNEELKLAFKSCLSACLSEAEQIILYNNIIENKSLQRISDEEYYSYDTVKSLKCRALKKLAARFY